MTEAPRQDAGLPLGAPWKGALGVLLAVAALARVLLMLLVPYVAETEGQVYLRIAENLAAGAGQVGIRGQGVQLFYPPLFPFLISLPVRLGVDVVTAGRLVSLLAGVLLVVPIAWIARRAFTPTIGLIAGVLAALHPVFVVAGVSTLGESLYFALVVSGVECALVVMLAGGGAWWAAASGLCAGLAYLIRPDAVALIGLVPLAIVVFSDGMPRARRMVLAACALGASLLLLGPYVGYLWRETGRPRLEAKSPENLLLGARLAQGEADGYAKFGVAPDGTPHGVYMRSNVDVIREADTVRQDLGQYARTLGVANVMNGVREAATSRPMGQPVLLLLAVLGLCGSAWPRRRVAAFAIPAALCGVTIASLVTLHIFHERYVYPFLPWLLVAAAAGIERLWTWSARFAVPRLIAPALLALAMLGIAARGQLEPTEFDEAWVPARRTLREAGESVKGPLGGQLMVAAEPTVAFYAGAVFRFYPFSEESTAVRYIDAVRADLLVLNERQAGAEYLVRWARQGPPPELAREVWSKNGLRVYRWRPSGSVPR